MVHGDHWKRAASTVGVMALLLPLTAAAFDAQPFSPAVDPEGYFSIYSSQTAPRNRYYLAAWYSHSDDTFRVKQTTTTGRVDLADRVDTFDLVGSYSLLDWLEVGLSLPISKATNEQGRVNGRFDVDDVDLDVKAQILDPSAHGLGVAIVPFAELPAGHGRHLTGDSKFHYGGRAVAELVTSRFRLALNGGYKVNDKPASRTDEPDEILFGMGAGVLLLGQQPILAAETDRLELIGEVFGSTTEHHAFDSEYNTPVEFLAGPKYYHHWGFQVGAGAGRRITDGINGPEWRVVGTVGYSGQPKPPPPPPPPPAPSPPQEKVVVTEEQIITLEPIYFDFDKSTIKPVSYPILDQVVKVMNERASMRVRVEGHTDSKGTDAYNQRLSQRRSESVVKYLISKGIAPSRLEAVGFGKSRPIAPNQNPDGSDNPIGRAKNRRTEFHVISQ
jgi:outer membrane protein OmpA-like peptidoglycan-associated protein